MRGDANWTGAQTLTLPEVHVTAVWEQEVKTGSGERSCVGSNFDARMADCTALTAFVSYCERVLAVQVVQLGAAPARAPSCAARVIAP